MDTEALRGIWADVLGAPVEGDNPSFFEVGGESITAMTLVFRVQETYGVQMDVGDLFEAPTLKEFAKRIAMHAS